MVPKCFDLCGKYIRSPIMAEEELKQAKKIRRNAKAALTRCGNWLNNVIEVKRPGSEVRDVLDKVEKAYNELVVKHEDYTKLIDDDTQFEEAENWMDGCQDSFMTYVMRANMYFESLVSQENQTLESNATTKKKLRVRRQTPSEFQV